MGKRLILLMGFLCFAAFILGLSTYKSEFNSKEVLNDKYLTAKIKSIMDQREADKKLAEMKASGEEVIVEEVKVAIDLNDPKIQAAIEIYTNGAGQCMTCHGDVGQGNAEKQAPLIAGQHTWYLVDHLTQLKNGKRSISGEAAAMHAKISDEEIITVSKYISLLRVE